MARASNLVAGERCRAENCVSYHGKQGAGMASFPAVEDRGASHISEGLTARRGGAQLGDHGVARGRLVGRGYRQPVWLCRPDVTVSRRLWVRPCRRSPQVRMRCSRAIQP